MFSQSISLGPGEVLCIPRGVVHRFDNDREVDAKMLAIVSPGILGPDYFREMSAVIEAAIGGPPDPAALADETAADTVARCHVVEGKRIPDVLRIETPESLIQVASARNTGSMDRALNGAFVGMMLWLTEEHGMAQKEAYLHFTANPDVRIHTYQFVGPAFYLVGVKFPKGYV